MIKSINNYWRYLSRPLLAIIVSGLIVGCASNKYIIKTDQPEGDFVVTCDWLAQPFLHGGKLSERHKVFVSSSNEEGDCGGFLYGDLKVRVYHPLYRGVSGCANRNTCVWQDGLLVITPVPFDEFLSAIPGKYKGPDLNGFIRAVLSKHFDVHYFKEYLQVRDVDLEKFKALYHDRFLEFIQIAGTVSNPDGKQIPSPAEYLDFYWNKIDEFFRKYYEKR